MSKQSRRALRCDPLGRELDARSERLAAAWRRILPFLDPLERRFLALERRSREAEIEAQLEQLRRDLRSR